MRAKRGIAFFLVLALLLTGMVGFKPKQTTAAENTEAANSAVSDTVMAVTSAQSSVTTSSSAVTTPGAVTASPAPTATQVSVVAPTMPVITQIKGGSKRVKLYWNQVKDADGYCVYYSTDLNGSYSRILISSPDTLKYVKKSLLQDVTYYFKLSAYRKGESNYLESPLTEAVSATTGTVAVTSTTAKKYSTTAKFKKSNIYKKFQIIRKSNYTRTFAMPGMKNTNVAGFASTKMIPQGICLAGAYLLVSAYDKSGQDESVIYIMNKSSKAYLTTLVMPNKTKLNALAYDGKNIWVTQGKKVSYFPYEVITGAVTSGSKFSELSAFTDTLSILTTGSYMTYYNNILWVGAYNASKTTYAYGYALTNDPISGKIALTKKYYMSIPNRTRAMAFDANGYLYLTRSAKTNSAISGYVSQVRTYKPSLDTPTKKGGIKKNTTVASTKLPDMAMGCAVYGKYLYNVFASCKYAKCTYKVDRVMAIKLTRLQ